MLAFLGCETDRPPEKARPAYAVNTAAMARIKVIGVVPISDPDEHSSRVLRDNQRVEGEKNVGELLAAKIEEKLLLSGRFTPVDRSRITNAMNELQLSTSDMFDSAKAAKLGKFISADALIVGKVFKADNFYQNNDQEVWLYHLTATLRLLDVTSAEIIMVATPDRGWEVDRDKRLPLMKSLDQEASAIVSSLTWTP